MLFNTSVAQLWDEIDKGEIIVRFSNLPAKEEREAQIGITFTLNNKEIAVYISYQDIKQAMELPED